MVLLNKRKFWWILAAVLAVSVTVSMLLSTYGLTVSRYRVESTEITQSFRVVQLTDLHNSRFGRDNRRLIEAVAEEAPDLILVTGDLVTQTDPDMETALSLLEALAAIAPTYVSLGNHEYGHDANFGGNCAGAFAGTGAAVLEYGWEDIEVNGQALRVGGIYGYCLAEKYLETGEAKVPEIDFLKEFQDTDRYTLLMAHLPITWLSNGSLTEWDADCVFSGHLHGGQFRLPFLGGVYAPDMGWFPGRVAGTYTDGGNTLILSRGLGTSIPLPRLNNIPEIVVTDFIPG